MTRFGLWIFMSKITHDFWLWFVYIYEEDIIYIANSSWHWGWYGSIQEWILDFKLGDTLKKIAPNGGRREKFWDISCWKSRFYAKKSYFFQFSNFLLEMIFPPFHGELFCGGNWFEMSDLFSSLLIFTIIKTILSTFFYCF